MVYFAYLKQEGEGCDYTIGCGEHLIKIEANSDEEAKVELSRIIREEYSHDMAMLESAFLFKNPVEIDVKQIYDELKTQKQNIKKQMQHLKDKEEYERLRRKFESGD